MFPLGFCARCWICNPLLIPRSADSLTAESSPSQPPFLRLLRPSAADVWEAEDVRPAAAPFSDQVRLALHPFAVWTLALCVQPPTLEVQVILVLLMQTVSTPIMVRSTRLVQLTGRISDPFSDAFLSAVTCVRTHAVLSLGWP